VRQIIAKITVDNRFIVIESLDENLNTLEPYFVVMDTSECWQRGRFVKSLAKRVCFMVRHPDNPNAALIPNGFLSDLIKILDKMSAKYKVFDQRKPLAHNFTDEEIENCLYSETNPIKLYDYQIEAVKQCLNGYHEVIKATTGAGKTEIFLALCKLTKKRTLILFKKIDLAQQTMRRAKAAGLDAGIVQGANMDEKHDIIMATVQSGHKINRNDYEQVIVDEMHNSAAEQYQDIVMRFNTPFRFGFSATPFTKNKHRNMMIISIFGQISFELGASTLIDRGILARPTINLIPIARATVKGTDEDVEEEVELIQVDWRVAEQVGIVHNYSRNRIIADLANSLHGQTLALVKLVDHGEILQKMIPNSIFMFGETSSKEREAVMKKFESGDDFTLIASTILDEGIDIKNVHNVILCSGGSSYIKVIQRVGRGMRTVVVNGIKKDTVQIFDFYDKFNKILCKHSEERIGYLQDEGYKVRYCLSYKDRIESLNDTHDDKYSQDEEEPDVSAPV
jgi:superfamily II DNA or RNA helicase